MENHNELVPKIDFEALDDGSDMFVLETIMGEGTYAQVFKARDKKVGWDYSALQKTPSKGPLYCRKASTTRSKCTMT